jgi:hypothetical protein
VLLIALTGIEPAAAFRWSPIGLIRAAATGCPSVVMPVELDRADLATLAAFPAAPSLPGREFEARGSSMLSGRGCGSG